MTRRSFGLKQAHFTGPSGMEHTEKIFFDALQLHQPTLMRSLWNPYFITEDIADEARREALAEKLRAVVRDAYAHLDAEWDGSLEDPIGIFALADPNLYRNYYAMCKLRALTQHHAYLRRQRGTIHSLVATTTPTPTSNASKKRTRTDRG